LIEDSRYAGGYARWTLCAALARVVATPVPKATRRSRAVRFPGLAALAATDRTYPKIDPEPKTQVLDQGYRATLGVLAR